MNKQKPPGGIEWTRIKRSDGSTLPGYTWNPTAGCFHGCEWVMPDGKIVECYAKTIAERFTNAYPHGFDHHYNRPHKLFEPMKVKEPSGIFVGSMADLFGHWVPRETIETVLEVMNDANWHIFMTLSKYPIRLRSFSYPPNVWVGVSTPAGHQMKEEGLARALWSYLGHMRRIMMARVRFLSIEPLCFDVAEVLHNYVQKNPGLPFEWVIIGAASDGNKHYQPEEEWVSDLLELMDDLAIPVFFKGNLAWPENDFRTDFPDISQANVWEATFKGRM